MVLTDSRKLTLADAVTLFNGLLGFLAITYIVDGRFFEASILILSSVVVDGLDGIIARGMGTTHEVGAYLDLFSDSVSFCFAPALLIYSLYYDKELGRAWMSPVNAAATVIPMVIVFFGVLRLSRFADKESTSDFYNGLPVPVLAMVIVLLTNLLGVNGKINISIVLSITVAISLLLYSSIKYPKLRRRGWTITGAMVLSAAFLGMILTKSSYALGSILLFAALSSCILYIIIGPMVVGYEEKSGRDS